MTDTTDKQHIVDSLRAYAARNEALAFAYLFGSLAGGAMHKQSDIDLAVFLAGEDRQRHASEDEKLLGELPAVLGRTNFDLVVLNYAPVVLAFEIITEGELVFTRDEQGRVDFETAIRCRYFDLKPHLDEYRRLVADKFRRAG